MKQFLFLFPLFFLSAEETPTPEKKAPEPPSYALKAEMHIDPKTRASDWVEAFQMLKNDKPTFKISLRAGTLYQNLIDLTASASGTLLYVKLVSNHGSKTVIVPTEQVEEITYSQ